MILTGRLAADAAVFNVNEKQVVRFRLVQNERFRDRGGGFTEENLFYECSYWQQASIVTTLKKGSIVELCGRLKTRAWADGNGKPQCELCFHVDHLKILGTTSYHTRTNI